MIRGDARLPGVVTALDTSAVLELLHDHLREAGEPSTLRAVEVQDVRYEPGRRCELLYRVKGDDHRTGKSVRQLLSARVVPVGEQPATVSADLIDRYAALDQPLVRTPALFFERPRIQLYAHPLDPDMPTLFDALDPVAVAAGLTRMWDGRKARARAVKIHPLGYTPHSRAAFSYEVQAEAKRTREPELRRLIGKMHAKKTAARLFAGAWAIWSEAKGTIGLAPPVGFSASLNLTFQERVAGERLGSLAGSPSFARYIRTTARYSAQLHRLNIPLMTRRKPEEEAAVVHRWSSMLIAIRPDLADRIGRLRDQLAQALETRVQPLGPVHGDFHHTNVLVDHGQVTIIDFDEMAFGDPLLDVGRFIASLRIPSLRTFGTLDGLADVRETFLREYMRHRPDDERRARLFEAATLFTAAASAFRIQRPNWSDEVELLVDEAARVFQTAQTGVRHAASPGNAWDESADPRWLRDPLYMRAALSADVQREFDVELTDIEVHKESSDGERVRYVAKGERDHTPWRTSLIGIHNEKKGAGSVRRLMALRKAVQDDLDAPNLARPIGFIRELGTVVFEEVDGAPLSALLDSPDGPLAASRFARALAAVHRATISLDNTRSLDAELAALRRQIANTRRLSADLCDRASALYLEIDRRSRSVPDIRGPVLRVLQPQHVLYRDECISLSRLEDVTLAHPFLDLGDFVARLAIIGLRQERTTAADTLAARFLDAYAAASRVDLAAAPPVMAGALLRLACEQAHRVSTMALANALVERADQVLAA